MVDPAPRDGYRPIPFPPPRTDMARYRYHTLDVFTDRIFGGNPLAVFPDGRGLDGATMQRIARELNLSETVFLLPSEGEGDLRARIFTPGAEVPFAGHPTVGTAVLAVSEGLAGRGEGDGVRRVVLEEGVGPVAVEVEVRDGEAVAGTLTAAAVPTEVAFPGDPGEVARMLGVDEGDLGFDLEGGAPALAPLRPGVGFAPAWASAGLEFFVVPVRSVEVAQRARLDEGVRAGLLTDPDRATMVYVVAPGEGDADLRVRMFAPEIGVPEDPATGSACAALGGWLGLRSVDGVHPWSVEQGIEMGRPSRLALEIRVAGGAVDRIRVGGGAVRVASGEMTVPG